MADYNPRQGLFALPKNWLNLNIRLLVCLWWYRPEIVKGSHSWTFSTLSSVTSSVSADLIRTILCPLSLVPSLSLPTKCYLFSTPPARLTHPVDVDFMLIHRVMNHRTMEPLGDRAHPHPDIQEYIHKASLTAARQKESEGVWLHSFKEVAMWWADMKINYHCHGIKHRAGNSDPETKYSYTVQDRAVGWASGDDFQSCDQTVLVGQGSKGRDNLEYPLRLSSLAWCD